MSLERILGLCIEVLRHNRLPMRRRTVVLKYTIGSMRTLAFSGYSATKAAIRNFARGWILDLKGKDIRMNVVSPGRPLRLARLTGWRKGQANPTH